MADLTTRLPVDLEAVWAGPDVVVDATRPHRRLQQIAEAASYWALLTGSGDAAAHARILSCLEALARQQDPATGLFVVGDNVLSPPDTSFTINGLTRLAMVLRAVGASGEPWDEVGRLLGAIVGLVADALRTGGVHTPNHRWEIASALARCGAVLGDPALTARAEQWLAEGVDDQDDGLYSERSPNYAAYVSNPSLTVLAEALERPDLLEVVHRNLHAHTLLTDGAGQVCTLQSRRQDQGRHFPVAPFEAGYRRAALAFGCDECAAMAARCAEQGGGDAVELAAELLIGAIPAETSAPVVPSLSGWHDLPPSELTLFAGEERRLAVRAASDVAAVGRFCSGVNHEPTFAAYGVADLEIGMRLSRAFFGLGPFRADTLSRTGDVVTLRERVSAAYYQPLAPQLRHPRGEYELGYEGRFAARLSFADRARDVVELATTVVVERLQDGLRVSVACVGPTVPLSLELALGGSSPALTGALATAEPDLWVALGRVEVRTDGGAWSIEPEAEALTSAAFYEPGEAVRYAGGTDAVSGPRLAVAWRSDTPLDLFIRRVPSAR